MRRLAVVCVAVVSLFGISAPAATAASPPKICTGAGRLLVFPGSPSTWSLSGSGYCGTVTLPAVALKTVRLAGFGSSDNLGICSNTLLVTNLLIGVRAAFTDVVTGVTSFQTEVWASPISLFPLVSPFLVYDTSGGLGGAGLMFSHIFLNCGNGGAAPSVQFDWAQLI